MFRHGDLLLVRVDKRPAGAKQVGQATPAGVVLAYGEATGHAHRIRGSHVLLWNAGERTYVTVDETVTLSHEEHSSIRLEPGCYEVIRQRQYAPDEIRHVTD